MASLWREFLTGANIRRIAEIVDTGEIFYSYAGNRTGGAHVETDDQNLRVHQRRHDNGHPTVSRVFSPLNALWRQPKKGATLVTLRPANHGAVAALALYGDGGVAPPDSLTDSNTVLSPETGDMQIESRDGKIVIKAVQSGASITINADGSMTLTPASGKDVSVAGGSARISRVGDHTAGHTHTATFTGTANLMTGAVTGTVTIASATDQMAEGAPHFKA